MHARPRRTPGRPRGAISWVTAVLLLAVASAAFFGTAWAPVFVVKYEVKQRVREYMNRAIRDPLDSRLKSDLCAVLAGIRSEERVDEQGQVYTAPVVDVRPEDVSWERVTTSDPPMLYVQFEYVHLVRYPLVNREVEHLVVVDEASDLSPPRWETSR